MAKYIKGEAVANATSYTLHNKNNSYEQLAEQTENISEGINFNLEELALTPGEYALVVQAHASEYESSDFSNEISYTVASEPADELAGTWYMNETIDATNFGGTKGSSMGYPEVTLYKGYKVNYTAGSIQSELFLTHTSVSGILAYKQLNGSAVAFLYNEGKWSKPEYRTIVITSKLSEVTDGDKLLAWMNANGTKTA